MWPHELWEQVMWSGPCSRQNNNEYKMLYGSQEFLYPCEVLNAILMCSSASVYFSGSLLTFNVNVT